MSDAPAPLSVLMDEWPNPMADCLVVLAPTSQRKEHRFTM
jgi:hypothetical protein